MGDLYQEKLEWFLDKTNNFRSKYFFNRVAAADFYRADL